MSHKKKKISTAYYKEALGIALTAAFMFFTFSIISFNVHDSTIFTYASDAGPIANWCGVVGANMAALLLYFFGSAVYLLLFCIAIPAYLMLLAIPIVQQRIRLMLLPLLLTAGAALCSLYAFDITGSYPGGLIGQFVSNFVQQPLGFVGAALVLWALFWMSVVVVTRVSVAQALVRAGQIFYERLCSFFSTCQQTTLFVGSKVLAKRVTYGARVVRDRAWTHACNVACMIKNIWACKKFGNRWSRRAHKNVSRDTGAPADNVRDLGGVSGVHGLGGAGELGDTGNFDNVDAVSNVHELGGVGEFGGTGNLDNVDAVSNVHELGGAGNFDNVDGVNNVHELGDLGNVSCVGDPTGNKVGEEQDAFWTELDADVARMSGCVQESTERNAQNNVEGYAQKDTENNVQSNTGGYAQQDVERSAQSNVGGSPEEILVAHEQQTSLPDDSPAKLQAKRGDSPANQPTPNRGFGSTGLQAKRGDKPAFLLPDVTLFVQKKSKDHAKQLYEQAQERGAKLEEKLQHFGIKGTLISVKPGPLITMFEYQPEIGSKISKITALEDDLAMALCAVSIRIIAPIPGKNAIGFEISNQSRETVFFSELIAHEQFKNFSGSLPLALGVDVVGKPVVRDLTTMPHLLIGGTTGSGKSVGLNGMLTSLLCARRPDQLRLILIDPKRLEFTPYADIPHLLFPIVTSPVHATLALKWVVQEMEERYERMSYVGVRNHAEYQKLVNNVEYESMPLIAVVIDELADLMIVAGKDVEKYIVRIAQMARAAGIHMIVATQRPSVDVVTGLIKVNFPSRIAFRVSSKVDSRTILDQQGAQKLLGKGDMLFMHSSSPHLLRIHGAYISDTEIESLAKHIRSQSAPQYLDLQEELAAKVEKTREEFTDDLYPEILTFIQTVQEISISLLQRHYRIGFNRSARIIERLEMDGLIAPAQGSKPRKILR